MSRFQLISQFKTTADQKNAIKKLVAGVKSGQKFQTLLGVTGSGKTFTMANVIQKLQKPTLVISHNKTLAWQLYQEFKQFFPKNEVHYFVSYYDYYQPEAYLPTTDTYIEKDAKINETIDKLRHAATQAVLSRKDVILVASVSCIYNIGDPKEYQNLSLVIKKGQPISRQEFLRTLVRLKFERNEYNPLPGTFSAKGETININLPTGEYSIVVRFEDNRIRQLEHSKDGQLDKYFLFPAKHFVTRQERLNLALGNIRLEMDDRVKELRDKEQIIEAARLEQRTNYDLEMLAETGYCSGIENYSRHLSFRNPGDPPFTLLDYFSEATRDNFLVLADESHMTIPQIRGMYNGDRARKEVLVRHGFRLPSALDNRPFKFKEWLERVPQLIFISATPADYEYENSQQGPKSFVAEQLLRPTNITDPKIEVRPTNNQIEDLVQEIKKREKRKERTLVTVITKRLAEDLAEHLAGKKIKTAYLHSEIHTLDRPDILAGLRRGEVDVLVGVNLLREGLDLPEVSLVAILDADKEGFLRNETTLVQTMGRTARHIEGTVIMYADTMTASMKQAIKETKRRREYQEEYNKRNNLKPQPIKKKVEPKKKEEPPQAQWLKELSKRRLEAELKQAVKDWDFETAILIRDYLKK